MLISVYDVEESKLSVVTRFPIAKYKQYLVVAAIKVFV